MKDVQQEQLIATRRHQILDAAARVFAVKGFHPTTIKDIAREAGIADGTLYNYFENKTSLLLAMLDRMSQTVEQAEDLAQFGETDLRAFMRVYLRHPLMALQADNFELFRVVVSEIVVNQELRALYSQKYLQPMLAGAEAYFQRWVELRALRPIDLSLTLRVISGLVLGLMLEHVIGDATLQARWNELPDFLTDLLLDGLAGDQS